jgi:hypothetical protein
MEERVYRIDARRLDGIKRFIRDIFILPSKRLDIEITLTPLVYLIPVYKYTTEIDDFVQAVFGSKLKFEEMDVINFEYLSMFRPVQPSKRLVKFNLYLKLFEDGQRIERIRAEEIQPSFDYEVLCNSSGIFLSQETIKAINMVRGESYSEYRRRRSSYTYYAMHKMEKEMFITATFLYSLYTGEYEAENLPVEWIDFLQGYGENFDEVVKNINFAMSLMGF